MTDSRYGAWDYDELTQALDSIMGATTEERGIVLDAIIVLEFNIPTILLQEVEDVDGNSLFNEEVRFTDPDDLIVWLDERYLHINL